MSAVGKVEMSPLQLWAWGIQEGQLLMTQADRDRSVTPSAGATELQVSADAGRSERRRRTALEVGGHAVYFTCNDFGAIVMHSVSRAFGNDSPAPGRERFELLLLLIPDRIVLLFSASGVFRK
jgi:hypothetical protein